VDWIGDYFAWVFDQGFAGIVVMLALTAVAALLVLGLVGNVVIWTMVGVKRLLGGDVSGTPKAEREQRRELLARLATDMRAAAERKATTPGR